MTLKRTVKSCRSDAPMLASSLREEAQATVSNKPGHRGEREVSRKTIARGMPGYFRCTCGDYARVLYLFRTRGRGCIGHPAFPAPSVLRGANGSCKTSGASRRENAEAHLNCRLFQFSGFILRDARKRALLRMRSSRRRFAPPRDEVLDPHGEERGNAARLEPRGRLRGEDFEPICSLACHPGHIVLNSKPEIAKNNCISSSFELRSS